MVCHKIDPRAFTNVRCKLKAARGRLGLLDLYFVYNNISRLSTSYKLYYRNANGRYLNYIIDITVDYCSITSKNVGFQNILLQLLLKVWNKYDNGILHGCPGAFFNTHTQNNVVCQFHNVKFL